MNYPRCECHSCTQLRGLHTLPDTRRLGTVERPTYPLAGTAGGVPALRMTTTSGKAYRVCIAVGGTLTSENLN